MTTTWTQFWDMHSGGGLKEDPYDMIYIEAEEKEAKLIFFNHFGHSPERVSCTCCGEDYNIDSGPLDQLTGYHRGCRYDRDQDRYVEEPSPEPCTKTYRTLADYRTDPDILFIAAAEITPEERQGTVPEQGYVWRG